MTKVSNLVLHPFIKDKELALICIESQLGFQTWTESSFLKAIETTNIPLLVINQDLKTPSPGRSMIFKQMGDFEFYKVWDMFYIDSL